MPWWSHYNSLQLLLCLQYSVTWKEFAFCEIMLRKVVRVGARARYCGYLTLVSGEDRWYLMYSCIYAAYLEDSLCHSLIQKHSESSAARIFIVFLRCAGLVFCFWLASFWMMPIYGNTNPECIFMLVAGRPDVTWADHCLLIWFIDVPITLVSNWDIFYRHIFMEEWYYPWPVHPR